MNVIQELAKKGHQRLLFGIHPGPKGPIGMIIAIHDLTLGQALGGVRMMRYPDEDSAIIDVLRLSRGMTYKAAVAGLNLGGGKAVIMADPQALTDGDRRGLFHSFGRLVKVGGGDYVTAEDVNTNLSDMSVVAKQTKWVTGLKSKSGDPSPVTAFGVFHGIRAALEEAYHSDDLASCTIAIQGLGKVGAGLAKLLLDAGATVIGSDVNPEATKRAKAMGVAIVSPECILTQPCDVLAPCALGAVITRPIVKELQCKIIAGAANNQLEDEDVQGAQLDQARILYAPDFVINAGGLINVAGELQPGGYNRQRALAKAEKIYDSLKHVFAIARRRGIPTAEAAKQLAEQRIREHRKLPY